MEGLLRSSANNVPLSPISFLQRAAIVYRENPSIIYGSIRYTWRETLERCTKLASALSQLGISHGDVVAALIPNIPAIYELHFAVPMVGAVLCALNMRHDSNMYGPATLCAWKPEWDALPPDAKAKIKARQGVHHLGLDEVDIKDPCTMKSVPADAKTLGEVMLRGNTVMNGYLKDSKATQEAFEGGWFRSGDLGVKHPDGYIELKDRSKDIIISGGENISSIEVESVLFTHPAVLDTGVVGRPDDHWGESLCAFVELKDGFDNISAEEIIKFCRVRLPHYMAPRTVVFEKLPKTTTGKTMKNILRKKAKAMGSFSHLNSRSRL